jgi:curved DNA-binding protein CbpA
MLELPARPWIEPEELKAAFHRLGAARHPDQPGGGAEAFAAVNAAWQTLRDPALRLRHLLELEGVSHPSGSVPIPPALANTFMTLAPLRGKVDAVLRQPSPASGTLAEALRTSERATLQREMQTVLASIDQTIANCVNEVRALDATWPARTASTLARLAELQQSLAFAGKWSAQLREALFQLGG